MKTSARLQRRHGHESSDRLTANLQPSSQTAPVDHQAQTDQPPIGGQHDFSQLDLFAHDPGPRPYPQVQFKLTTGTQNNQQQETDTLLEISQDQTVGQIAAAPPPIQVQKDALLEKQPEDLTLQTKPLSASETGLLQQNRVSGTEQLGLAKPTLPDISSLSKPGIQASFISFAVKMGTKRVALGILKNFIKTQIKDKIQKIAIKKFAKQFVKEADDLVGILEDPWWATAIGFIPIVGDAFDLARVPKQIANAIKKADALEEKVKKILRIQGKKAGDLIPATLKKSDSYMSELENRTYADIIEMAEGGTSQAKKMKKLTEQTQRLMDKL